jgi:hypothetical protein
VLVIREELRPLLCSAFLAVRGGLRASVDPDLYAFLNQFKWFPLQSAHSIYVCTRRIVNHTAHTIRLHRLIVQAPAFVKVHHINHDTFDNRRENLLQVTEYEHRHFDGWHIFYH